MNGFLDKCFECKYFSYVDRVSFDLEPQKYGRFRDGLCYKSFPRGYTQAGKKPPFIIWSRKASCFQFEPKETCSLIIPGLDLS